MEAWNKMSIEEAREKALLYNPNLIILDISREGIRNEIKFKILCPICGKERDNSVLMSSIKNSTLACKKCKHEKIGRINSIPKKGKSFYENDYYNRTSNWDFDKNNISPNEVSQYSGIKYWFICDKKHSFDMAIGEVNHGKWCPHCSNLMKESKMASVLKQVIKNEFPHTIWEYNIGFKGEKGGSSSYDIFIPELNMLIECQSEYHDCKEQSNLDIKKKLFAIDSGYDFLAIDYRDFEPIEAIKLFFPNIKQVPHYVDYTKNTRVNWDINKAQFLLDNTNLNQKEVAEKVNADIGSFYDKINRNILIVPEYKKIKIPIVQLKLDGTFVARYDYARDCVLKYDYSAGDICSCCKGNQITYKGFLWMYESDYNNKKDIDGNIIMTDYEHEKILKGISKEIVQLTLKGKYVDKYKTITEAELKTKFLISNISACCYNKTKTSNGYIWMFKDNYDKVKDINGNIKASIKYEKTTKYLIGIDLLFNIVEYESARVAEKSTDYNFSQISYKCRKKSNNKDSIYWMLKEDYLDLIKSKQLTLETINTYKINKYS